MSSLREAREALFIAHNNNIINDEEFLLLYDLNRSQNPDFQYSTQEMFNLDAYNDDECRASFRFLKNDIYYLKEKLDIPDELICYNRLTVPGDEALCILLKRYAYPCRLGDMIPVFYRPVPEISIIAKTMTDLIYNTFHRKLTDLNQNWLSPDHLQEFADTIHARGAPLTNCWGFIDGTV